MNIHGMSDREKEEEIRFQMASPRATLAFAALEVTQRAWALLQRFAQFLKRRPASTVEPGPTTRIRARDPQEAKG